MKRAATQRKRKERALKRAKKKSWVAESLKRKRISLDVIGRRAKEEQAKHNENLISE